MCEYDCRNMQNFFFPDGYGMEKLPRNCTLNFRLQRQFFSLFSYSIFAFSCSIEFIKCGNKFQGDLCIDMLFDYVRYLYVLFEQHLGKSVLHYFCNFCFCTPSHIFHHFFQYKTTPRGTSLHLLFIHHKSKGNCRAICVCIIKTWFFAVCHSNFPAFFGVTKKCLSL